MRGRRDRSKHGLRHGFVAIVAALIAIVVAALPASADAGIEAVRASLPDKVRAALARIPDPGRGLLALHFYARGSRSIERRWSWTREEIAAYEKSAAHATARAAIDALAVVFAARNPGYSLHVNSNVRSLDEQIANWNRNASVAAAAAELAAAFATWRDEHPKASDAEARTFLIAWKPSAPVAIAAPGLSPHGRARAFDFQIAKGTTIIAAASTRIIDSVWEAQGWTGRLRDAVVASGLPFKGPLERPREPWHYEYRAASPGDELSPPIPLPEPRPDTGG